MNENTTAPTIQDDPTELKKAIKSASNHNSCALLLFLGLTTVITAFTSVVIAIITRDAEKATKLSFLIGIIEQFILAAPLTVIIMKATKSSKEYKPLSALLRKPDASAGQIVRWILICFFIGRAVAVISQYFFIFLEFIIGRKLSAIDFTSDGSSLNTFVNITALAILAPLCEETIFRGIIANNSSRFGSLSAIITSGLCFGLFHMNYEQIIYAAALGFCLAFLLLKTKSLITCIIFHVFFNFFGTLISLFPSELLERLQKGDVSYMKEHITASLLLFAVVLATVAVMITGLILFIIEVTQHKETFKLEKVHPEMSEGKKILVYFTAPVTVVTVILLLLLTIVNAVR